MATKSRNKSGLVWSLIAIALAAGSFIYCASFAVDIFSNGWTKLHETVGYFSRIITGGDVS